MDYFKDYIKWNIHPLALDVINKINSLNGQVNIGELVEKTGYCHRYVNRVFKKETGLSMKQFASIIRFQKVIHMLTYEKDVDMNDLINETGYYDQAHMINEFKKYTSYTMGQFCSKYLS